MSYDTHKAGKKKGQRDEKSRKIKRKNKLTLELFGIVHLGPLYTTCQEHQLESLQDRQSY